MSERKSKLNIAFAFFSYSGSGGVSTIHPSLRVWWGKTLKWAKSDERIGEVVEFDVSDTPITMTRNAAVVRARSIGADVLVMIDSDQWPDMYDGKDPLAHPFMPSSFDFLWSRYPEKMSLVAAPYCGPPPQECVYAFQYVNWESDCPPGQYKLEMISRSEAAKFCGIHPAAAIATGLVMIDMRCFELTEPKRAGDKPWFYYEYRDIYETEKGSTEDVVFSRNIAVTCMAKHGYNPVFVNWDAWAGHMKPKCVGKPFLPSVERIHQNLVDALLIGHRTGERTTYVHRNEEAERALEASDRERALTGVLEKVVEKAGGLDRFTQNYVDSMEAQWGTTGSG